MTPWIIFDKWLVNNDEQPFPRRCFSFIWKKNPKLSYRCLPWFACQSFQNSSCRGTRRIRNRGMCWARTNTLPPKPMKARVGRCVFFPKRPARKGGRWCRIFWWSCLLFKMFGNLARPFFLENLFKKDGSKDPTQRLQSCEITGYLVGCFSEWSWMHVKILWVLIKEPKIMCASSALFRGYRL